MLFLRAELFIEMSCSSMVKDYQLLDKLPTVVTKVLHLYIILTEEWLIVYSSYLFIHVVYIKGSGQKKTEVFLFSGW